VGTAAAVIVMKEKHVVAAFRAAHATTSESARSLDSLGVHPGLATSRLSSRGVLRESQPGAYYLDEARWEALRRFRRRVAGAVLVLLLALVLIGFVTFGRR
jgi:hypothetical protein